MPRKVDQFMGRAWNWGVFWDAFWGGFGRMMGGLLVFSGLLYIWADGVDGFWGRVVILSAFISIVYGSSRGDDQVRAWRQDNGL